MTSTTTKSSTAGNRLTNGRSSNICNNNNCNNQNNKHQAQVTTTTNRQQLTLIKSDFKPYTQSLIVRPGVLGSYHQGSQQQQKQLIKPSIELFVEVNTPKWRRDPVMAKKCLRMIWRLVKRFNEDTPCGWQECEFDYEEAGITVIINNNSNIKLPIRVRINNLRKTSSKSSSSSMKPMGKSGLANNNSNNNDSLNARVIVRHCDNIPLRISLKENRAPPHTSSSLLPPPPPPPPPPVPPLTSSQQSTSQSHAKKVNYC